MKAKFPEEDRNAVQAAAAAARVASVTEPEGGSGPKWRPEGEFNPHVDFEIINSRNALSGAGSNGLCFSHLQSIIRTQFGQEHFGAGIEAFWRRTVDEPDVFLPEFWELFLQSNLTAGKMPPCLCGDGVEDSYCGRDYEGVETAYGGAQSRSKAVWRWGVGRGGACSITCPNTP